MGQLAHLFQAKYKQMLIFGAPKLYHNFGGRVKGRAIVFFYGSLGSDRKIQWPAAWVSVYNFHMDKTKTLEIVRDLTNRVWDTMGEIHPRILKLDQPTIYLCGRLTRTAGKCYQTERKIHLGWKFFQHSTKYRDIMYFEILPHELIHQIDYDLWGDSEKNCGHGKNWQMLMVQYGLEPKKYHSMDLAK